MSRYLLDLDMIKVAMGWEEPSIHYEDPLLSLPGREGKKHFSFKGLAFHVVFKMVNEHRTEQGKRAFPGLFEMFTSQMFSD